MRCAFMCLVFSVTLSYFVCLFIPRTVLNICVLFCVNNFIYPFFIYVSPLDKHGFWGKHPNKVYIKKQKLKLL